MIQATISHIDGHARAEMEMTIVLSYVTVHKGIKDFSCDSAIADEAFVELRSAP
jgi:hypothetical protein